MTKIVGATLGLAMAIGVGAGVANNRNAKAMYATPAVAATLTFTSDNSTKVQGYTSSFDQADDNSDVWTLSLFNNNNWGWSSSVNGASKQVKCGNKTTATVATIQNKVAFTDVTYTKIDLYISAYTSAKFNSIKIYGSNTSSFATKTELASKTDAISTSTTVPTSLTLSNTSNFSFYQLAFDTKNGGSSNGFITLDKVVFWHDEDSSAPAVGISSESVFFRVGGANQTVTATPSNFSGTVSYSWTHQSGVDCVDLTNTSSATVTMTPKNTITAFSTGVYRVTATYNTESASADVAVTVDNGTELTPYTVTQARAAIDRGIGVDDAYVKGFIYKIESYSQQYNSLTYWISDDGTNNSPLEVYSGLNINGTNFTGLSDLSLGDIVIVTGELKKNSSTYEFNYNNQLVSRISIDSISVKTTPTDIEYNEDEYFDPTGLVVTATYNDTPNPTMVDFAYSVLGEAFTFDPSPSVALSNQSAVEITLFGKSVLLDITVTPRIITGITVTGEMANKIYVKGSAWDFTGLSLTIAYNIGDALVTSLTNLTVGSDFTVSNEKADGTTSLTISGTYSGSTITSRTITDISYTTTVTFVAGTDVGSTNTFLSKSGVSISVSGGDLTRNDNYRPYANQTMTVSCEAAHVAKISFACTTANYNNLSSAGYTKDGANGTWLGYSKNVVLNSDTQSRISQITVHISEVNSGEVDALKTSTVLSYHYSKDGGAFEYSNVSIRFGGLISKTLWNGLDTDDHSITGFGVMITEARNIAENETVEEYSSLAVLAGENPDTYNDLVNYFMPTSGEGSMATPVESGDNYFWNLFQRIDETEIETVYVAAAYVKVGGDYVFMEQVRYSAKTLAADYIANRGCNGETADGSLANLATPQQA